jgi:hypothetical protein
LHVSNLPSHAPGTMASTSSSYSTASPPTLPCPCPPCTLPYVAAHHSPACMSSLACMCSLACRGRVSLHVCLLEAAEVPQPDRLPGTMASTSSSYSTASPPTLTRPSNLNKPHTVCGPPA